MTSPVALPLWLFLLLLLAACYAVVVSVLFPGVRWFFRRRLNRAVDRVNAGLRLKIRPFQRTKRQVLIDQLVFDQDVIATIEAMSRESGKPREALQAEVRRYAREIVPAFNAYIYFRLGYWLARKVSRFIYRVRVATADRKKLEAIETDATVVFVMNHRSNMDYVLICYLAAEQVTLSYAVGEWARIFPLDSLIRAMGAFFVRRGSQNPLYRKVLERYVYMATQSGVCQAVFLEGGLSRDGGLGTPKLGFLDYVLRHYDWPHDRNIVMVPVGINYDRVLEDRNLLDWDNKSARPGIWAYINKLKEFVGTNFFVGSRHRWKRHGYASVNFGIPLSMRDYCEQRDIDFKGLEKSERIEKVAQLASELMQSISYVIPILPVPVIAAVLVRAEFQSLTAMEILLRSDALMDEIMARGAAMKPEEKPRPKTMTAALDNLITRGLLEDCDQHIRVADGCEPLLAFYANSIGHWGMTGDR